tara:strand:- start:253 stop:1767 length:1515 start_codon:yes stop_codon:yes gene_type:complete
MTTVIIPTVGIGSRMQTVTPALNKALLLYKNKPILAHIIDQFPTDTKFLIPVGYLSQQIIDFCQLAYADRNIEFIPIEWKGDYCGTGYTLSQCASKITGPFWYVACDTYFEELLPDLSEDCYFVREVNNPSLFTMFKVVDERTADIVFKTDTPLDWVAFTGLMYIQRHVEFFDRLRNLPDTKEFIPALEIGCKVAPLNSWLDFGNPEVYLAALKKSQAFDFTKKNEVTYICNKRVIKWWADNIVATKKMHKVDHKTNIWPANCAAQSNWFAYDYFPGHTLYESSDPMLFTNLLRILDARLWVKTQQNIVSDVDNFYRVKTLARIDQFKAKYPDLPKSMTVNGVLVDESIIQDINWNTVTENIVATKMHGDLQFDNIVVDSHGDFKLIDWRQEFGTNTIYGDVYYDLAKLAGGLLINYAKVKQGQLSLTSTENTILYTLPSMDNVDTYMNILYSYAISKQYNLDKIKLLVPIIFLNMAPLHTAPFDQILWYHGLKTLHETILQPK